MKCKTSVSMTLPSLGIGTWSGLWGRFDRPVSSPGSATTCIRIIRQAIQNGIMHIDTAEMYGKGYAEALIGEAIAGMDRQSIFLTSKVRGDRSTREAVIAAANNSLGRLKTDYLDLYLIHWYESEESLVETLSALDYLVEHGLVKNIGVSNFNIVQMKAAQQISRYKIVANQVEYNLLRRNNGKTPNVQSELISYCRQNDIFVIAYNPLAGGVLSNMQAHPLLRELSAKYRKTSAQISLRWLVEQENVVAIPGTTNQDHLMEIGDVLRFELEPIDHERLTEPLRFRSQDGTEFINESM